MKRRATTISLLLLMLMSARAEGERPQLPAHGALHLRIKLSALPRVKQLFKDQRMQLALRLLAASGNDPLDPAWPARVGLDPKGEVAFSLLMGPGAERQLYRVLKAGIKDTPYPWSVERWAQREMPGVRVRLTLPCKDPERLRATIRSFFAKKAAFAYLALDDEKAILKVARSQTLQMVHSSGGTSKINKEAAKLMAKDGAEVRKAARKLRKAGYEALISQEHGFRVAVKVARPRAVLLLHPAPSLRALARSVGAISKAKRIWLAQSPFSRGDAGVAIDPRAMGRFHQYVSFTQLFSMLAGIDPRRKKDLWKEEAKAIRSWTRRWKRSFPPAFSSLSAALFLPATGAPRGTLRWELTPRGARALKRAPLPAKIRFADLLTTKRLYSIGKKLRPSFPLRGLLKGKARDVAKRLRDEQTMPFFTWPHQLAWLATLTEEQAAPIMAPMGRLLPLLWAKRAEIRQQKAALVVELR